MNEYELKSFLFRKYNIEYETITKRLYIHKPIEVKDLQKVRQLTKNDNIQEIIVVNNKYTRMY